MNLGKFRMETHTTQSSRYLCRVWRTQNRPRTRQTSLYEMALAATDHHAPPVSAMISSGGAVICQYAHGSLFCYIMYGTPIGSSWYSLSLAKEINSTAVGALLRQQRNTPVISDSCSTSPIGAYRDRLPRERWNA